MQSYCKAKLKKKEIIIIIIIMIIIVITIIIIIKQFSNIGVNMFEIKKKVE